MKKSNLFEETTDDPLGQPDPPTAPKAARRKAWRRSFTIMPRAWELRLLKARRIVSYHLACELLYLHWLKGDPIAVSSAMGRALGLSSRSRWNALAELEQLGLIEVERTGLQAPSVTLLQVSGE